MPEAGIAIPNVLERLKVGKQGIDLRTGESVAEGGHLGAATHNHFRDAIVIGRHAARQVLLFVEVVETGAVQSAAGIRLMAAGAIGIKNVASDGLVGSEAKLGVGLSGLGLAAKRCQQRKAAEQFEQRTV